MLERFLIVWLVLSSALAYAWPAFSPADVDPFLLSAPYLTWVIAVTMFSIGAMLPHDEVRQVAARWPSVLAGTAIQYTAMPVLAYCAGRAMGFQGDYLIGVVMVGCVPGAMASNVLTLNARGNTSYSVSLTTAATLLSPLVVPFVMQLTLATEGAVDLETLRASRRVLVWTVVLPVIGGHLLGRLLVKHEALLRRCGSSVSNVSILWIIAVVVALNRDELSQFRFDLVLALLTINLGGYLSGFAGGTVIGLPPPMRRALTLEIGMQNAGLGATLATQLFENRPVVAIAPAMYTFGCMLTGTVLARSWALWQERKGGS